MSTTFDERYVEITGWSISCFLHKHPNFYMKCPHGNL